MSEQPSAPTLLSNISSFIVRNATSVLGTRWGKFYLAGVACSVGLHAILRAERSLTRHIKERPHSNDESIEPEVSAALHGAGWGFLQGLIRGWIWPVHAITLAAVFGMKKRRENARALAQEAKKKD